MARIFNNTLIVKMLSARRIYVINISYLCVFMKRVLIISYYWPPTGGSGVQRWVKFAKYLPSEGWQPVIYTPENPE